MGQWREVSPQHPCPICEDTSWCAICDGDNPVIKCMKVSEGSFAQKNDGSGEAFFHRPGDEGARHIRKAVRTSKPRSSPDLSSSELLGIYEASMETRRMDWLVEELGLPQEYIAKLGVGWLSKDQLDGYGTKCKVEGAYTFPMRDVNESLCGFRLRADGFKYSLAGGNNGFFIPPNLPREWRLTVVEGPTDAAAALAYGLHPIGRPNNTAFPRELARVLASYGPRAIDIIIDNDEEGSKAQINTYAGAESLVEALKVCCPDTAIRIAKPTKVKDLRQAWSEKKILKGEMEILMEA